MTTQRAILYEKHVPRYLWLKAVGRWRPAAALGPMRMVSLREVPEPALPSPRWVRVRPLLSGICGSDLATVFAKGSPYFSPLTSCPFVLGHEVVGVVTERGAEVAGLSVGDRVVLEPALGCLVRGIEPMCDSCREGNYATCANVTRGCLGAGIQTGYCRDTGGAWSDSFVAHENQLFRVPDSLDDELAVLAEPFTCAVHSALKVRTGPDDTIFQIGCGTMGLLMIAAMRFLGNPSRIVASAWTEPQKELALQLGATEVLRARGRRLYEEIAGRTAGDIHRPEIGDPFVLAGADCVIDCVASSRSIQDAVRLAGPRSTVLLVGMPAIPRGIDWTPIWHKELRVTGTYAYGYEIVNGERKRTFEIALDLLERSGKPLTALLGERFPLEAYRDAFAAAACLRPSTGIKTLFDMR